MNLVHGRNSQKKLHLPDLSATMLGNLPNKSTLSCNIQNSVKVTLGFLTFRINSVMTWL